MRITALYRYPIKGVGVETIHSANLAYDGIEGDRRWAMTRQNANPDPNWAHCGNFLRGATNPSLMAVTITRQKGDIILHHPARPDFHFSPNQPEEFANWLAPLCQLPVGTVYTPSRALTDSQSGLISLLSEASLAMLQSLNPAIARERFRGNVWFNTLPPWRELELVGKHLRIGNAELKITEPIKRCKATHTDTTTGQRDFDTLTALRDLTGTQSFGLYAQITRPGTLTLNDEIEVL